MADNYQLTLPSRLLHDQADPPHGEVDTWAASGDLFITLATQLDSITHRLRGPAAPELENMVRQLMHLQRHYRVMRKAPDYRQ